MRALLVALNVTDPASLRAALAAALGATSVDLCQATEAAVTWLENRPCDLVAVAGQGGAVVETIARLRRVSKAIPVLAVVPDPSAREAGAAWLSGADDVVTASALAAGTLPEGLDEVRHPERDVLRKTQRLWYAGPTDSLRQQLVARLGARLRDVGLTAEGLAGLTTQDVEAPHSAALIVNAAVEPESLVLGVRRVKRTYPNLAISVVADGAHHDAFRRAGADECVGLPADADPVLHAVGRAQAACRASLDLDVVRSRETRLRALLEHLPEAVMLVSPEHTVLAVNLAALRLIGAPDARQVIGTPLAPWFDASEDQQDSAVAFVEAVSGGATRELFTRTRHLADPRRLQLRAVPFQRESGGPPAALIVLRDVVEAPTESLSPALLAAPAAELAQERENWHQEREALQRQLASLDAELADARAVELTAAREAARAAETAIAELAVAREELMSARDLQAALVEARTAIAALTVESEELQRVRPRLEQLDTLGVDLEAIPGLLEATQRLIALEENELPALRAQIEAAQAARGASAEDAELIEALRSRLERYESLGVDVDTLPALLDEARRLSQLEQSEVPALRLQMEAERDEHLEEVARLRTMLARLEARPEADPDLEAAFHDATRRLTELETVDIPSLRDAAVSATAERELAVATLEALQERVHELEATLSAAEARRVALEHDVREAHEAQSAPAVPAATVDVPAEHGWILQDIAQVGFVRTTSEGRILECNAHAASLCGYRSPAAFMAAGALPEPLTLLATGDGPSRFEVCLQVVEGGPARWIAGARLPEGPEAEEVTWLLADASAHRSDVGVDPSSPDTLAAVLEVVAAECASIVDERPVPFAGPRAIDAEFESSPSAARALDRARVLLAQVSTFRKRREGLAALDELRTHLTALDPVLRRLATDDVAWSLSLPDDALHVSASGPDIERCLTALVTSARDALPLGGRLSLVVRTPGAADVPGTGDVHRFDAHLVLEAQGYGVADIDLPSTLREFALGFGGVLEVRRVDALTQQLSLRVPRAFVVSHAA